LGATKGEVRIGGYDIVRDRERAVSLLGYMPETSPLYPEMRVGEYLRFRAELKRVKRSDRRAEVERVLERAKVRDMEDVLIDHLSKGYRQRVGLADALIGSPPLLILDEPTAGLDPKQIIETRRLIKELAGTHTIILSTHILPEVSQTCQRVVIINKGKVVAIDTPETLIGRLRGAETMYLQVEGEPATVTTALERVPGITRVNPTERRDRLVSFEVESEAGRDVRSELARAVVGGGFGLLELRPMRMSLEDVFLHLTTEERPDERPAEGVAHE
jgi:ABC-2 type transport system ATP-binding protein